MNDLTVRQDLAPVAGDRHDFVTVELHGQLLGIPVLAVHDVLSAQKITHIPLAPNWVSGVLNLRGRIVTAIDLRQRLGLSPLEEGRQSMSVVVEHRGEPYSLQIDTVGEVLSLDDQCFEKNPVTLDAMWRDISRGIYRLDNKLLVILDVDKLLEVETAVKAA